MMKRDREELSGNRTKSAPIRTVISECETTIVKYQLETLLAKAKRKGFGKLDKPEIELLTLGLIKLGEALTFCRDRSNDFLKSSGIVDFSIALAKARNHLVHHQLYHSYFSKTSISHFLNPLPEPYAVVQGIISKLPSIAVLNEALNLLKESSLTELTKPIGKGSNNFPFFYSHYLFSLKQEFLKLEKRINSVEPKKLSEEIKGNVFLEADLENRIRNILCIMVDLTDTNSINRNKGDGCKDEKEAVRQANLEFIKENHKFSEFFDDIKQFRNALCHLDDTSTKPYHEKEEMAGFLVDLRTLANSDYMSRLEQAVQQVEESSSSFVSNSSRFFAFRSEAASSEKKKRTGRSSGMSRPRIKVIKKQKKEEEIVKPLVPLVDYPDDSGSEDEDKQTKQGLGA